MSIYTSVRRRLPERVGLSRRKGARDLMLSSVSALLKTDRAWGRPVHLTIEPTNICDQRCPVCETGAGILRRDKGSMSLEGFRFIIDTVHEHTNTLFLVIASFVVGHKKTVLHKFQGYYFPGYSVHQLKSVVV